LKHSFTSKIVHERPCLHAAELHAIDEAHRMLLLLEGAEERRAAEEKSRAIEEALHKTAQERRAAEEKSRAIEEALHKTAFDCSQDSEAKVILPASLGLNTCASGLAKPAFGE
jgi:DNA-binding transcriptional regulator/RsmH inhibitor MraZ